MKLKPIQTYSETFFCQLLSYNKQSLKEGKTLVVVQFRAVPNDGNAECWDQEDEKERSSIWVTVIIPGHDIFIFL